MSSKNYEEKTKVSQVVDDILRDLVTVRKNISHCGFPGSWRIVAKEVSLISDRLNRLSSHMSNYADDFQEEMEN